MFQYSFANGYKFYLFIEGTTGLHYGISGSGYFHTYKERIKIESGVRKLVM
jgi:hypothetical protein